MAFPSCSPRPATFRWQVNCADTGSSSRAITWPLSPRAASLGWSTTCRSLAWRNSARRERSARAFCRRTSTTRGSIVARYSNTLAARFHLLADKLEDLRKSGEVTVHRRRRARQDPLSAVRSASGGGRRVMPALPAQEGDRRPALDAPPAAVAHGSRNVLDDGLSAWPWSSRLPSFSSISSTGFCPEVR